MMTEQETAFLGIAELGRAYRAGTLSPLDVVRQAIARLERLEPQLNAVAHRMDEEAIADAERLDAELRAGQDRGPLHGIPVAVKDLVEIAGQPTGYGSRVRAPSVAAEDALLVTRLREAGAIILCKSNLLEYAYGIAHPDVGQTNNPHDIGRTSGGSSGGSAALVAAGIVPVAVGTDTGGSIRIPASYCGIVGLKPTFGLVPLDGTFPLSWTLDHAGPLARSAADAAILLECLSAGAMPSALTSLDSIRIGVVGYHAGSPELTPAVAANMAEVIERLRASGAVIVDLDIAELREANSQLRKIILPEASVIHAPLHAENADGYAPKTRSQVEAGFATSAFDYLRAQEFRARLLKAVEARFADVDVLLGPSVPFPAPIEDPEFTEDGQEGEMLSSGFANMTGQPSVSLPSGMDGHLPIGIQLTAALGADARLLAIAGAVEAALDAYRHPSI